MRQRVFFFFSPLKKNIESFAVVVREKRKRKKRLELLIGSFSCIVIVCPTSVTSGREIKYILSVCVLLLHVLANCDNKVRSDASTWGGGVPIDGM